MLSTVPPLAVSLYGLGNGRSRDARWPPHRLREPAERGCQRGDFRRLIRVGGPPRSDNAVIGDPPTKPDLEAAGVEYLYMALNEAISVAQGEEFFIGIPGDPEAEEEVDLVKEYWVSTRRQLAKSASLLQMGTELLLKSRVAEVSPYLLLDSVSSWPKAASKADCNWDDFRTIDARLLPQVINTVGQSRLADEFIATLDRIRKRRNAIVHSASEKAVPTCEEIVHDVLEVAHNLIGTHCWPALHRAQAWAPPFSRVDYHDQITVELLDDFSFLLDSLRPADVRKYLGISKKQRRYLCPSCRLGDLPAEARIKVAVLQPNRASSTTLFCIACGDLHSIRRKQCADCPGNVVDDDGCCLSCAEYLS